ncbi:prolipoprotein diacylglyceryl transferase [Streptomonospora wellingtoniae]|uniref:Uncharacterized protein n=1 Tax=Streptomonospora wellingtoniae TaxID=3075544 RepID=A0ABU2KY47_9ACTN|nr:hypothetical protein [Streptomonospora sp. DSM 45055]MDT0304136.1 hypothetical protein [Streptomonospora sp. DSM 45055]
MRKHQKRWIALAGAATLSVAGLAAAGGPASAEHRPGDDPPAWPVVQQNASTYSLDGFDIAYLPPGLERFGLHAASRTGNSGERVSTVSWVQGADAVYGRVGVVRSEDITDLDDLREARYGRIDDESLQKTEANGFPAYVSEKTGELFWVPERGVAVEAYLQPDRWKADELAAFAGGVERRSANADSEGAEEAAGAGQEGQEGADAGGQDAGSAESPGSGEGAAEKPEEEVPEQGAGDPAPGSGGDQPAEEVPGTGDQPAGEAGADQPAEAAEDVFGPGVRPAEVRTCVAEALLNGDSEATPARVAADDGELLELWRSVGSDSRDEAARACAERFGAEPAQVERMMAGLAAETGVDTASEDAGVQEGAEQSAESGRGGTGDGRQQESSGSGNPEDSSDSDPLGLWEAIPWSLPDAAVRL